MAKFAQPLLVIAGAVIGAELFGNPFLGAALGGLAGQLLFPTKLPTQVGPRLNDIAATVSNVGAPIPRGWGTFPATGCIIVQTDLLESIVSETVGGSGGPEQTTETPQYHQTFAIGINDGPIGGVRVIWANGKAIYDRRPQGGTETGGPEESDVVYQARQAASDQVEAGFTLYLGTEAQFEDPGLQAFFGVGNISAFRGLAYIVFHDWLNKPEDGNRMPSQWKFEVFGTGDRTDDSPFTYGAPQIDPWVSGDYPVAPQHDANYLYSPLVYGNGQAQFPDHFDTFDEACASLDEYIAVENFDPPASPTLNIDFSPNAPPFREIFGSQWKVQGYNVGSGTRNYLNNTVPYGVDMAGAHQDWNFAYVAVNCFPRSLAGDTVVIGPSDDPNLILDALSNSIIYFVDDGENHYFYVKADNEEDLDEFVAMGFPPPGERGIIWETTQRCRYIRITRRILPPDDPCLDRPDVPGASDYCVTAQGTISVRGPWEQISATGAVGLGVLLENQGVGGAADTSTTNVRGGPVLLETDPNNTEQFWSDHYNLSVLQGSSPAGLVYGTNYPSTQNPYYRRPAVATASITTGDVALSDIVSDLCAEAGLDPATQVDVTALIGLRVLGYVRTSVMAARGALIPLCQAYFFDGVESEAKITWRPRGADVVAELDDEDLGAAVISDNDTGPPTDPRYTLQDTDDMGLPVQVRVHYMSPVRDYESGEQDSPYRADTTAVQISDVELPIVLTDDHAMQIAQSLWAQAWVERTTYTTVVDGSLQAIEASDPVAVPIPDDADFERTVRMRITQITDTLPASRQLQLVMDDAAAYVSHAVSNPASSIRIPRPVLAVVLPADAYFLDLPGLRDQDSDAGFYFSPFGAVPSEFSGAGLYRSTDGGGNFSKVSQAGPPSVTVGSVVDALPAGPTDVFDYENTLHVKLLDNTAALFSSTQADVLGGANAAAIGVDGRWEVIQFVTATQLSASAGANVWALTGLLRGRRGTEWAVGTSQVNDQFTMLNGLVRVPLDSTQLGAASLYKVVGTGGVIDGAPSVSFTGRGVALKPFSPVNVRGHLDNDRGSPSTFDWVITWMRRNRIGQTLQGGNLPMSESSEHYEIDVLSGSTVKRTLTVFFESEATYTEAQQVTDFGSVQTTIHVVVYQISNTVGRGYGTAATLISP